MEKHNIFCIEGLWQGIKSKSSVQPILDLLLKQNLCDYLYHDCATKEELEFYLNRWKTKSVSDSYPILYLAFHGRESEICINGKDSYTLEELGTYLEEKCLGKVIYFGSCSTFNIHGAKINSFLKKTGAIAAIGYKSEIDWIQSTACDLFVFDALQSDRLDTQGIHKIEKRIKEDYGNLSNKLDLRFEINEYIRIPRRRKK